MGDATYRYELRRGDEIVATGRLTDETPLDVGERITIGRAEGVVRQIEPTLGVRERHLVVQLLPPSPDSAD